VCLATLYLATLCLSWGDGLRLRWYWGLKLYLLPTTEGMPVAWCLADPKLGEREVAAELLGHVRGWRDRHPGLCSRHS